MTRRLTLLIGIAAVIALCTGCQGTATGANSAGPLTVPAAAVGTSNSDELNSQLDNLRSGLNNVQSQLSADAAP